MCLDYVTFQNNVVAQSNWYPSMSASYCTLAQKDTIWRKIRKNNWGSSLRCQITTSLYMRLGFRSVMQQIQWHSLNNRRWQPNPDKGCASAPLSLQINFTAEFGQPNREYKKAVLGCADQCASRPLLLTPDWFSVQCNSFFLAIRLIFLFCL